MTEYVLIGAMAALVLLMLILRTNTAICFLALCAGSVLLASSGENMSLIATSLTSGVSVSTNIMRIILLFAPLAVCIVLLRKQMPSALMPMAFVPAACTALLGAVFILPLLSDSTELVITQTETWKIIVQYQEAIVGIGIVVSLVLIALTVRKHHDKHHKKGHH